MIDYYQITPQKAVPIIEEKKALSRASNIFLYVFFGSGIGAAIMASLAFIIFIISMLSKNEVSGFGPAEVLMLLIYLALFYPFALAVGSIPAMLTGWILNCKKPATHQKLYSFVVGFIVCFIFYFMFTRDIESLAIVTLLSVIGGIAAAGTKRLIEKKELRL